MNNMITQIIAQAAPNIDTSPLESIDLVPVDFFWNQITSLTWLQALIAISFGAIYLFYGWRIFRLIAFIMFALIGLGAGMYIGRQIDQPLWGAVVGLVILAIISIPLIKYSVAVLGGAAGAVIGGAIWYAIATLPENQIWAGMLTGAVAGFLLSFIIFKLVVMLFTSLAGTVICAIGVLALLHLYETNVLSPPDNNIEVLVLHRKWFLPAVIIIPTIIGMFIQNRFIKKSDKWEL